MTIKKIIYTYVALKIEKILSLEPPKHGYGLIKNTNYIIHKKVKMKTNQNHSLY